MTQPTQEIAISDDSQWRLPGKNYVSSQPMPTVSQSLVETTALTLYLPDFRRDALFHEVLRQMQQGAWQKAVFLLETLKAQYPATPELEHLTQDAMMRVSLEQNWGAKVQAKRSTGLPWRVVARVVPAVLLVVLLLAGFRYYGRMQQVYALNSARQALIDQADSAMQAGQFEDAINLYGQVLTLDPENEAAKHGQLEAQNQLGLAIEYNAGVEAMQQNNSVEAMKHFVTIENKAPGYRDVAQLMAQLKGMLQTQEVFSAGEKAYQNAQWGDAISQYETLRSLDSNYEAETVVPHLIASYMNGGQAIITHSPEEGADLKLAQDYFRKVLKLNVGDPAAKGESDLLESYFVGQQALDQGDLEQEINSWLLIYQQRPQYLNGYVAQQLYQAYLTLGKRAAEKQDYLIALDFFSQAANLQVPDTREATQLANEMAILLTPTPTPVPTTPPLPTPTPTPLSISMFKGWIIFESERDGNKGLYMMRPDGSEQQPAPADARDVIDQIYEHELWSPDGNSHLYVSKAPDTDSKDVYIYKRREDLPADWNRDTRMTDFAGLSYDPAWSPDNKHVAFVATTSGNDEIWIMDTEGQAHKQLTYNTWEWDKHPTWSADGSQLAFYSNRTGKRQIFVMNPDGSSQINISDNAYDDWNPVWVK